MQTTVTYRPEVIRESPTQYAVSSQSDISRWYTVAVAENIAVSCTCPARVPCKHQRIVSEHIALDNAPKPQPTYTTCVWCGAGYYGTQPDGLCSCGRLRTAPAKPTTVKAERPIERHPWGTYKPGPAEFMACSRRA